MDEVEGRDTLRCEAFKCKILLVFTGVFGWFVVLHVDVAGVISK